MFKSMSETSCQLTQTLAKCYLNSILMTRTVLVILIMIICDVISYMINSSLEGFFDRRIINILLSVQMASL